MRNNGCTLPTYPTHCPRQEEKRGGKEDIAQKEKTLTILRNGLSAFGMSLIFVCTNISTPKKIFIKSFKIRSF